MMNNECNQGQARFCHPIAISLLKFISSVTIGKRPRFPCRGNGVSSKCF